jgi:hypothetical protein
MPAYRGNLQKFWASGRSPLAGLKIPLRTVLILVGGEAAAYPVPTSPTSFLYSAYEGYLKNNTLH